ncbi:MAG TPA: lactate utilization protein C, partial [Lysinibacillus sp.]|nr:lactate utilization protein C [Lysinibacillus sp.]
MTGTILDRENFLANIAQQFGRSPITT